MIATTLYRTSTDKSVEQFLADLNHRAECCHFIVEVQETAEPDLINSYSKTDLHLLQIHPCHQRFDITSLEHPENSEKYLTVFNCRGTTEIRFLSHAPEVISQLLRDEVFPESLSKSYRRIIDLIDEARLET